jgi:mannose-6-phosphate isomerase
VLLRIESIPRPYAWGSHTAIADLMGTAPSGGPEAELWFGDHPGAPAQIVGGSDEPDLAAYLTARGQKLPFLLKVLAAAEPLSLQAHPTIAQARDGFARENAAGIALDDPARTYKDELHKPELIYALSDPFIALAGFRPLSESLAMMRQGAGAVDAEGDAERSAAQRLALLTARLEGESLSTVASWIIGNEEGIADLVDAVADVAHRLEHRPADTESWATVRRLAHYYPGDPGIVLSLLMHTVILRPGEALYLPTGNIHSYQSGLAIEIMAASDNVVRGGLTRKHVDVPELMRVLDARPVPVPRIEPVAVAPGVQRFAPGIEDFCLTVVSEGAALGGLTVRTDGPAIVLCLDASLTLQGSLALHRGQAAYVDDDEVSITGEGRAFIATGRHPAE